MHFIVGGRAVGAGCGQQAQILAMRRARAVVYARGEVRVARNCMATIGQVGNVEAANIKLGKAGASAGWGADRIPVALR